MARSTEDIIATQRLELGRAAKLNGNISNRFIDDRAPAALFEGSCKMIKATTGAANKKENGRERSTAGYHQHDSD